MLTKRQKEGTDKIKKWFKDGNEQLFVLAGYAGTGKSFMTKEVIRQLNLKDEEVAYCTFTGKASLVLSRYHGGNTRVSTIHKLIYEVNVDRNGDVTFHKRSSLPNTKLIVIDEASMVNGEILRDLMSFKIPILAIGDHGQLPPIGEDTNLMKNPDFTLTEILRQAEGNPIIYLSKLVREGKKIDEKVYGDKVFVYKKNSGKASLQLALFADQVICGFNKTRASMIRAMRQAKGFTDDTPQLGDKVIFTNNNWGKELEGYNIVNGMMGYITNKPNKLNIPEAGLDVWNISMKPDFLNKSFSLLNIPVEDFEGKPLKLKPYQHKFDIDRMQFGDVITAHKSQGSQFDTVMVWNEPFGDEPWRWSYTAITRASNKLILAI